MEGGPRIAKKRKNKNRPEERSSKQIPKTASNTGTKPNENKVSAPIDPRFDSAFGDFNERSFNSTFGFLEKIKKREKSQLMKQLRKEKDPPERKKIHYLLERMKNQEREKKKRDMKQKQVDEENKKFSEAVFRGERPTFPNKKEQMAENLLQQFKNLNARGKLNKYIMKKNKKVLKHKQKF